MGITFVARTIAASVDDNAPSPKPTMRFAHRITWLLATASIARVGCSARNSLGMRPSTMVQTETGDTASTMKEKAP